MYNVLNEFEKWKTPVNAASRARGCFLLFSIARDEGCVPCTLNSFTVFLSLKNECKLLFISTPLDVDF